MSNPLKVEIGLRIKQLRKEKGLSRSELSEMADISTQFLGLVETGKRGLSPETVIRVSHALGVTTDFLLLGQTDAACGNELTVQAQTLLNAVAELLKSYDFPQDEKPPPASE